jgi:hypothetical protein
VVVNEFDGQWARFQNVKFQSFKFKFAGLSPAPGRHLRISALKPLSTTPALKLSSLENLKRCATLKLET